MKFTELKSSLNEIKNCYYVCGKDAFLRQSSQKLIENACAPNLPDFNILRFDDENFNKNSFLDGCRCFPMGDNYRVVVVKAKNTKPILTIYFPNSGINRPSVKA